MSKFSYCPLILMFHDKSVNAKINHIHERALRIANQDLTSSFEPLLIKDTFTLYRINFIRIKISSDRRRVYTRPTLSARI